MIVIAVSLAVGLIGVRGGDYPAHFLRQYLWDEGGFGVWNNLWYGGHATPTYSLLTPPLTATFGVFPIVVLATAIATYCFSQLTNRLLATSTTRWANLAFAVGALTNVIVGRVPFAVGFALALGSLWALAVQRPKVAVVLAVLTPLGSPVAGVFLGVAALGLVVHQVRSDGWMSWRDHIRNRVLVESLAIGVGVAVPLTVLAVMFGSTGWYPFLTQRLALSMLVLGFVTWRGQFGAVRIACGVAMVASLVVWAVPNPMGGNFIRFAQLVVVPVAIASFGAMPQQRRSVMALMGVAGVFWATMPGVQSMVAWSADDSTTADFYAPLIDQIAARNADGSPLGRVEIPFTHNHWESYFVATKVPFARGWEGQVDRERNEVLYDVSLNLGEYHRWLRDNGVRWIAVPDTLIGGGGLAETGLVEASTQSGDASWIKTVWENENWVLYEVVDYQPIVDLPAQLDSIEADSFTISTPHAATITIRFEFSDLLEIDGGACLTERDDGLIQADLPAAGTYRIAALTRAAFNDPTECA